MAEVKHVAFSHDEIKEGDKFLVDTNVLIYLYGDTYLENNFKNIQAEYSSFIKVLRQKKCHLYTTELCLSEFCNVLERKHFDYHKTSTRKKMYLKQYRNTEDWSYSFKSKPYFHSTAMRKHYKVEEVVFKEEVMQTAFSKIKEGSKMDFFDLVNVLVASDLGVWKFISHDSDFRELDASIVYTANPRLARNST